MARHVQRPLTPEQARRRTWVFVGAGCGAVIVLALIVLGVIYARFTGGPALPPEVQRRATAPAATPSPGVPAPAQIPPLRQQVESVAVAARSGQKTAVVLYVTDAELNQGIAEGMRSGQGIKSAKAYFGKSKVYVVLTADWRGRDVNLTVTAAPVVVNGGLQFGVETVKIGAMKAPAAVAKKIQEGLNQRQREWSPAKTGVHLSSVEVREGLATLRGTTTGSR